MGNIQNVQQGMGDQEIPASPVLSAPDEVLQVDRFCGHDNILRLSLIVAPSGCFLPNTKALLGHPGRKPPLTLGNGFRIRIDGRVHGMGQKPPSDQSLDHCPYARPNLQNVQGGPGRRWR
jgi:hypothetical protein